MDGHSGLGNDNILQKTTKHFGLVLSELRDVRAESAFVVHAAINFAPAAPTVLEFFKWLGFTKFSGACQFHNNKCSWRVLAISRIGLHYSKERCEWMKSGFTAFASRIEDLFDLRQKFNEILSAIQESAGPLPIFNAPVDITARPDEMPAWVDEIKTAELRALETQNREITSRIADKSTYLLLVTGTGDPLVQAVIAALRSFGLKAEPTERGANIDVLAWKPDESRRFGLEVTGIEGVVKKESHKLAQIQQFVLEKSDDTKAILVANTHRQIPVLERPQENFTRDAMKFFDRDGILVMTGYDLYRLAQDVFAGKKTKEDVVELLYTSDGEFCYS